MECVASKLVQLELPFSNIPKNIHDAIPARSDIQNVIHKLKFKV